MNEGEGFRLAVWQQVVKPRDGMLGQALDLGFRRRTYCQGI